MKWNQEDLFFSGFFSALNTSGEVFFDGDILRYLEYEEFKIYCGKIKCNDVFVLIATKDCSDSIANLLLRKMIEKYYYSDLSKKHPITRDHHEVENEFLSVLDEVLTNQDHLEIIESHHAKPLIIDTSKEDIIRETSEMEQELQELRNKIIELELKLGSLSMTGRSIGHTLNNVLSAILGNVTLSKLDSEEDSEQYENLSEAEQSCSRARDLTSKLLTISRNISKNKEIHKTFEEMDEKKILEYTNNSIILGKGKILVLDDEHSMRHTTEKMIARLGYDVDTVASLEEALRFYQQSMKKRKYDAVILDLSELGGLGGFGALMWLKIDPNINAIVSSGYAKDPIFRDYTKHGFRGVLKKPYDISQLSRVLNKVTKK